MTDFEILEIFRTCHIEASNLGLVIEMDNNQFQVKKDGEILISKMKINQIENFIKGYKCAFTMQSVGEGVFQRRGGEDVNPTGGKSNS